MPTSLPRKLPFDHDLDADSVLGQEGNKRGHQHKCNKQNGNKLSMILQQHDRCQWLI